MKHILAQIDDLAAKAIYQTIAYEGTATFQDLIESGYKKTTIHNAVKALQENAFIQHVGKGVYRDAKSSRMDVQFGRVDVAESPTGRTQSPAEWTLHTESSRVDVVESPIGRTQSPAECGEPPAERSLSSLPLTLVNNVITKHNKLNGNFPKIASTDEIHEYVENDAFKESEQYLLFRQECLIYDRAVNLPGLSRDVIWRLVTAELWLGVPIAMERVLKWRSEAVYAERSERVKDAWMAFSKSVQKFYEEFGIKWTKCRPNKVLDLKRDVRAIKKQQEQLRLESEPQKPVETLMIQYPDGRSESAAELLSNEPGQANNHQPLESLQSDVYMPKQGKRERSSEYKKAEEWVNKLPRKDERSGGDK